MTLCELSPTLCTRVQAPTLSVDTGNYRVVYPQASYWNVRSVLGKVLAPLSLADTETDNKIKCLGGWIGPCPSPALPEPTFGLFAELRGRPPPWIAAGDPAADGNAPITGPFAPMAQSQQGNTAEWMLPTPPPPSTETAMLQTLRLTEVAIPEPADGVVRVGGDDVTPTYQAHLDFRLGEGKPMATTTVYVNSIFVAAVPCRGGPHRIEPGAAAAYSFRILGVRELPHGELDGGAVVTVINATGGPAAETSARAWCSEKGTNAVVWKREEKCCFKCSLMMAGKKGVATGVLIMC